MVVKHDLVFGSLSKVQDLIFETLSGDNTKLHERVANLESRISTLEYDLNKQNQYTRHNNLDIQGILDRVSNWKFFRTLMSTSIEMTFRTANAWVNEKQIQLSVLSTGRIARRFWKNPRWFKQKNGQCPYNQHLAWICKKFKQAGKITAAGVQRE